MFLLRHKKKQFLLLLPASVIINMRMDVAVSARYHYPKLLVGIYALAWYAARSINYFIQQKNPPCANRREMDIPLLI